MGKEYAPVDKHFWEKYGFYEDELGDRREAAKQAQDNIAKCFGIDPRNVVEIDRAKQAQMQSDHSAIHPIFKAK